MSDKCVDLLAGRAVRFQCGAFKCVGKIRERSLSAKISPKSHRINGLCVFVRAHNPKVVS